MIADVGCAVEVVRVFSSKWWFGRESFHLSLCLSLC